MLIDRQRRQLFRHGFIILFIALILGLAIMALPNPGRWLAAHVSALMTGLVLAVSAAVWRELRLTDGQLKTAYWGAVIAAYAGVVLNVLGAIVDLPGPASNPGVTPPMPQALLLLLLILIVPSLFVSIGLGLYGLRGEGGS